MNTYSFNGTVTGQEAEALKEMIFKRARERAQAYMDNVQASYTEAVHNDVMELARDSFVSAKNPFSEIKDSEISTPVIKEEEKVVEKYDEIGFAKRSIGEIKSQIVYRNKTANADLAKSSVESTMQDARVDANPRASFMGALNFLNSQASLSLINKGNKNFDALA